MALFTARRGSRRCVGRRLCSRSRAHAEYMGGAVLRVAAGQRAHRRSGLLAFFPRLSDYCVARPMVGRGASFETCRRQLRR